MDDKLSKYLRDIEAQLRALPEEKRDEELREIRSHLEAIIARLVESGLSEEAAVEAAIEQFDASRQVGRELQEASGVADSRGRTVAAVTCAAVCYLFLNVWSVAFIVRLGSMGFDWIWRWHIHEAVFLAIPFVSGLVAGCVAPRGGGHATLCLFGGVSGLIYAAMRFNSWLPYATLVATMLLVWLGALAGSRGVRRQIERT